MISPRLGHPLEDTHDRSFRLTSVLQRIGNMARRTGARPCVSDAVWRGAGRAGLLRVPWKSDLSDELVGTQPAPPEPDWIFSASNIVCRTAPASKAPQAADAVALRASLDPDAYFGMSARKRRSPISGRRHRKPRSPTPLTHHAPSGMTPDELTNPTTKLFRLRSSSGARTGSCVRVATDPTRRGRTRHHLPCRLGEPSSGHGASRCA